MVLLVTSSVGDSELIRHFQEAYARLFSNCYNKQGILSNLPSYRPMNQGTICAKVYPEGVQQVKGNNCGLIPAGMLERARKGEEGEGCRGGEGSGRAELALFTCHGVCINTWNRLLNY